MHTHSSRHQNCSENIFYEKLPKCSFLHKAEPMMREEVKRNSKKSTIKFCMYRSISRTILHRKRPGPRINAVDTTVSESDYSQKSEQGQASLQNQRRRRRQRRCLVNQSVLKRDCQATRQFFEHIILDENPQQRKKCKIDTACRDEAKDLQTSLDECVKNLKLFTVSSGAAPQQPTASTSVAPKQAYS